MTTTDYTLVEDNLVSKEIYEFSETEENRVVKGYVEPWTKGQTFRENDTLITNLPIAATDKTLWDDFWNKYELYVKTETQTEDEDPHKPVELEASDFRFIDYIGPSGNKKVYATSPTKGVYTLSLNNEQKLVVEQVCDYGCCNIVYHETSGSGFFILTGYCNFLS